jgi:hypothetical protein
VLILYPSVAAALILFGLFQVSSTISAKSVGVGIL